MTEDEKRLLLRQALKLVALGIATEREREQLKALAESGVPYSAPEMLAAGSRFDRAAAEWSKLEQAHLKPTFPAIKS